LYGASILFLAAAILLRSPATTGISSFSTIDVTCSAVADILSSFSLIQLSAANSFIHFSIPVRTSPITR